jgi:nitrite reductase (NADH) small subunit
MTPVVALEDLPVERGVCVLLDGEQVALVRTSDDVVHAVDNLDPVSGAMVMSRGIVGSRGDRDVLISPMHKQAYDLASGECLDLPGVRLRVHPVQVRQGTVEVELAQVVRLPA